MSLDYYSEIFKKLLLRNVAIKCGTKTCRAGKIQNFDIKQFYVKLFIENNKNNIKVLELPYPYTIQYIKKQKNTSTKANEDYPPSVASSANLSQREINLYIDLQNQLYK